MNPNLNDMIVFLSVVEAQSFSAAADQLGRTRSAVSQSVSRLEADVGARLLYRTTRSLTLTEAGTRLLSRCRDIKLNYDSAVLDLQNIAKAPTGSLTATAPHAMCSAILMPAIVRLNLKFPEISVRIIAEDARIDLIEAQIDLAVRVGRPSGQTAMISKLGVVKESLYVSTEYLKGKGGIPGDLNELGKWDHIANDWQGSPIKYTLNSKTELTITPRIRCNAFPHVARATIDGLGVARLPDIAMQESVALGQVVAIAEIGTAPIYSMHHFEKRPPPKVKALIAALRAQVRLD